jgi:DNA primase
VAATSVESKKLLKRVAEYYGHSLSEGSDGLTYLRDKLQIHHNLVIEDCQLGYSDGSLVDTLPEDPAVITRLTGLGILDKKGRDRLRHCIVVPLRDASGDIVNLYARNVRHHRARYMRSSVTGLINPRAFKACDDVILTASVTDLLVIYDRGLRCCAHIHCGSHIESAGAFHRSRSLKRILVLAFNTRRPAACIKRLIDHFTHKGIAVHPLHLPGKNALSFFSQHTIKEFEQLVEDAKREKGRVSPAKVAWQFERTEEGFYCIADGVRQYEIKGIRRKTTQLKVTIKASMDQGGSTPFELSTVDMYSYRARIWFAKLCADLFAVAEDIVQADLHSILEHAENLQVAASNGKIRLTEKEKHEALAFLRAPDLMERILADFEAIGVIGEQTNKLVGYLAAVSRKLDEPLSVLIQSRSAAGKSTLQDGILALVPPEDVLKYTRITDQALFYSGENTFAHKILAIEEGPGMKGAAYSIRNIQSSGKITIAATGKSAGEYGLKTRDYTVKGPVAVMLTTTASTLDEETASRFIVLSIDESARMTRAIHDHHRRQEVLNGVIAKSKARQLCLKHHNAQRLLKPVLVVNPYARHLSYPSGFLKARRDFGKYLGLIKVTAFLHQYQRERLTASINGDDYTYIQVTLADIEQANALAAEVMGQCPDDLPMSSRQLLKRIHQMVMQLAAERGLPVAKIAFTRRMIREHTGWSNWQVRTYLPPLLDYEYLILQPQSRVNRYSFAVNTGENSRGVYWAGLQLTPATELERMTYEPSNSD